MHNLNRIFFQIISGYPFFGCIRVVRLILIQYEPCDNDLDCILLVHSGNLRDTDFVCMVFETLFALLRPQVDSHSCLLLWIIENSYCTEINTTVEAT